MHQADAINCTRSIIFTTLRGKNLLIRDSSSLIVKLRYTFIHDTKVWTNLPPRPKSQSNIHIHDTQVRTKGDLTKLTRREHYYKQKGNIGKNRSRSSRPWPLKGAFEVRRGGRGIKLINRWGAAKLMRRRSAELQK